MNYPQYRKYKNDKSYFKIYSENEFEELVLSAKGFELYKFNATILPDRNYISDMLHAYHENWDVITETEYNTVLSSRV